ncbi:MAG TPA: cytochrome c [Pirellulales bacterium]|nr:cytochrome c [Pirellulales bacterium]
MICRSPRAVLAASLVAVVSLGATGCDMLDMYDQPRYEPLEASEFFADGGSARPIVAGTVPRGWLREDEALYTGKLDGEFVSKLPVKVDRKLFERGQERFNIYCSVCHGRTGEGDGMIVRRGFRKPPSLVTTQRLLEAPAGHFFDVMTNGFGAMPSYASRVSPEDRWAIVAYIRALQLGQNGRLDDVPEEERKSLMSEQVAVSLFAPRKVRFFAERKTTLSRPTASGRQAERP